MKELENFFANKTKDIDACKLIHDILHYPKYVTGEDMPVEINDRFFCKRMPNNLSTISFESILKNINFAIKYISENKHNIIFMDCIKNYFRNLVNKCMTDFIFYLVYYCAKFAHDNNDNDEIYDYFIHGEYIRNFFSKEFIPCKTIEINISKNALFFSLENFLNEYFHIKNNYSNLKSYKYDGDRFYYGRSYFTLYPMVENKNFMKFLLSRSYIKNILQLLDESDWYILFETINDIKMDLFVTISKADIKTNIDVNSLCLRIPCDPNKIHHLHMVEDNFRNALFSGKKLTPKDFLEPVYDIPQTQLEDLDNILNILQTKPETLIVNDINNFEYNKLQHDICIITLHDVSITSILNKISNKNFKIYHHKFFYNKHKCINIYSKKCGNIWKKRSRHAKLIVDFYNDMIINDWTCINDKCNNPNCVLYSI
ncbi:hypothetical protein QLL95_gp0390 [Cotonvirus japonicus]|uniref:Uncharacterized protein n=1 Tax=Cotonvirus japonicus TaxID=2811091 RepID=A0ABM7NU78_9VIRU|nr:hypothetical protein QLL95_gp0390 [Cotonvirus japonicus]BCS83733.1 hypothetical protein [Cotonvirus japonicus]